MENRHHGCHCEPKAKQSLAQTLAQTGIYQLVADSKHVAPGRAWLGSVIASREGVAPGRAPSDRIATSLRSSQ
ncbi:MAG: hypothetical protein JRF30_00330 [Deltaproteobacteria bacterium]|nr:hypothetical protein [Deltaproteobacteria bacterium]MBW2329398.1 hypothetical protein [Deltaproteobacteria bacterium]